MKILYHHRIAARDGMDVHKTELIKAFRSLGHEVIEVGPSAQQRAEFGADGGFVDIVRKILPPLVSELLEIAYDQLAYARLRRAFLRERPDFLYERHNLFLSAGKRLKERYGIPFYLEVNAPLAEERENSGGLSLKRFAHEQEGATWQAADRIFPVTEVLAGYLRAKGVNENQIEVIPNAVDPNVFYPGIDDGPVRKKYGLEGAIVLGFTGFIRDWHGLDMVINAMPDLADDKNVHFLVVGDGPARAKLEAEAASKGLQERVHFTGIVSRDRIPAYIATFDIALQPAVTAYASPLKLFEYLAMGTTTIAPDQPNIREATADTKLATLVEAADTGSFATAIKQLVNKSLNEKEDGPRAGPAPASQRTWQTNASVILGSLDLKSGGGNNG